MRAGILNIAQSAILLSTALAAFAASAEEPASATAARTWRIEDMVEVCRVASVAVNAERLRAAAVVRCPSLSENADSYTLYEIDYVNANAPPRTLAQANFIADVTSRPGTRDWLFRADLGRGVQLYTVAFNRRSSLLAEEPCAPVYGYNGIIISSYDGMRCEGILGYGISPDGARIWYSTFANDPRPQDIWAYDPGLTFAHMIATHRTASAKELKVLDLQTRRTTTLAVAPGNAVEGSFPFDSYLTNWQSNTRVRTVLGGASTFSFRSQMVEFDIVTGAASNLELPSIGTEQWSNLPFADGYLAVRLVSGRAHLVHASMQGDVVQDFGETDVKHLSGPIVERDNQVVFGAAAQTGPALYRIADGAFSRIGPPAESLSHCATDMERAVSVCSAESFDNAPRLVLVSHREADAVQLLDLNPGYRSLRPFSVESVHVTNALGSATTAYILLPREFHQGATYPAVVVTHGDSATNEFVPIGNQWHFPVQMLLESGYVVVLANEPGEIFSAGYVPPMDMSQSSAAQHWGGLDGAATMEAVAQLLITRGLTRPGMIGLAGYSRGGSITALTLSRSHLYAAGIIGDAYWYSAGGFWQGGGADDLYRSIFGGPPLSYGKILVMR